MADIVGSLFGASPQAVQAEMTAPIFNRAAQFAQLTPMQQAQYGLYSGGAMLGQGLGGLLGGEDPRLVQARQMEQVKQYISQSGIDINSPEGLAQAAQYAQSIGATEGAMYLGQQSMALRKGAAEEQYKLAQAQAALREKKGTPETQAEQVRYNQLVNQLGEEQGSIQFLKEKELSKGNVAARGAAVYGGEKIGNLTGAQGIVEGYVKKPYERLQAIGEAKQWLGQAAEGNTAAVPQLKRALVRLGGPDSQLAAKEIATIAGNAGIAGNVVNAVNSFLTGTPTKEEIKLIGKVIGGAENVLANQYTQGRQQAETVLGAAKLDPQTRAALLPPAYKLPEQKSTQQGGWKIIGVK